MTDATKTNQSDNLPAVRAGNAVELRTIGAETQLAIHASGRDYLVSPRDIIEWTAPSAPLSEAKKFLVICQTTGLNPLLGEIDLLLFGGKWQAVARKNGYLKCARHDSAYDGHESGVSVQEFQTTPNGKKIKIGPIIDVQGTCVPDGHLLVGGWCKMYRRGLSRPTYKRVSFSEYGKSTPGPWQSIPCTMIEKVAIAHAARESFDLLAGTYDDSEMDRNSPPSPATVQAVQVQARPVQAQNILQGDPPAPQGAAAPALAPPVIEAEVIDAESMRTAKATRILELVEAVGMTGKQFAKMLSRRSVGSVDDLDEGQAIEIIRGLETRLDTLSWNPLESTPPAPADPEADTKIVEAASSENS